MKKRRNKLDEMQEQKLLTIEHNGCWLAFWGLFAALVVQALYYGPEAWKNYIGEWIVFMCLALYMVVACLKNGIWDRKYSPTPATNLIFSIGVGIFCGMFQFASSYRRYGALAGSAAAGVFQGLLAFAVCMAGFAFVTFLYHKKVDKLENENEEDRGDE